MDRLELGWCAGFLEGDGTFFTSNTCPGVAATQKEREPLERLQRALGGTIYSIRGGLYWKWNRHGNAAIGIMFTLYTNLSKRRQKKIREVIEAWKARSRGKGGAHRAKTHCPKGHPYSGDNLIIQPSNGARKCRACRDAANARRAA